MISNDVRQKIIKEKNLVNKSNLLISFLFSDVIDKAGVPYIGHLHRVGNRFENETLKVIGYMHDIMEDTYVNEEELLILGFTKQIVDSIKVLTKLDEELYSDFIDRIIKSGNEEAMMVKRSDLEDNMNIERIPNPTSEDYDRIQKYKKAHILIEEALRKRNEKC